MASSKINVTDLDFAQIKSNLKTFLKAIRISRLQL